MKENEEIYIVTDGCMWEQNKKNSTYFPHGIEVVNLKTGAVQIITSGSIITFIEGEITSPRTQQAYNEGVPKVSSNREAELQGAKSKRNSNKKNNPNNKVKSI